MQDRRPDLVDWHRALTLAERAAAFSRHEEPAGAADADERSRHRLAEWRGLTAFRSGTWWDRRLADLGLDEEGFARLLALPPHRLGAGPAAWMDDLADPRAERVGEALALRHLGLTGIRDAVHEPDLAGRGAQVVFRAVD